MKTVKKMALVLAVLALATTAAFSDGTAEAPGAKKGVFGKIAGGFAESTRNINEANKENIAAVKAESKANFKEATAPSPGMVKVREAKGFGNKIKAIAANIAESSRENSEKEKARRAEIQSQKSYKAVLEEQRENRQNSMSRR